MPVVCQPGLVGEEREQGGVVSVISLLALEEGALPDSGRNISFQAPVPLVLILLLGLL